MSGNTLGSRAILLGAALVVLVVSGARSAEGGSSLVAERGSLIVRILGKGTVKTDSGAVSCSRSCRVLLPVGTEVSLGAEAAAGWHLDSWRRSCSGSGERCDVVIGTDTVVVARFRPPGEAPTPRLNELDVTIGGSGTVASDPAGLIQCPMGRCSTAVTRGRIELEPAAQPDWVFEEWRGACKGAGSCVVSLTRTRSVQAVFKRSVLPTGTAALRVTLLGPRISGARVHVEATGQNPSDCVQDCPLSFRNGTVVTLTWQIDAAGLKFGGWGGACQGASTTCVLIVSGTQSVTVSGPLTPLERRVAVNVTRSGEGYVESFPPGISCGSGRACSAAFGKGTNVRLAAKGSGRYEFDHWGGACSGETCAFMPLMDSRSVSAVFRVKQDTLRVTRSGDGDGTVTSDPGGIDCGTKCSATFARGTRVVLRAIQGADSHFVGWRGACSGDGNCAVTLGGNTEVTARFDRIRDRLSVTKEGDGRGTVTSRPAGIACGDTCRVPFPRGTRVELRAEPDAASRFVGWSGTCSGTGSCAVEVRGPAEVGARFALMRDALRVVKVGQGQGLVESSPPGIACGTSCGARFVRGTTVVLRASPAAGSRFARWAGACSGTHSCTVNVRGPRQVEAWFARICAARSANGFGAIVKKRPRRIVVTIRLAGKATGRLRLFRGQRKIAEKTFATLRRGTRTLRLNIPPRSAKGKFRVRLRLTDACGSARVFTKKVTIPHR